MSEERSAFRMLLDGAASTDVVTPTYSAMRNLSENGKSFTVTSGEWAEIQPSLEACGMPYWGVACYWVEAWEQHAVVFNVGAADAEEVERVFLVRPSGGRIKALLILFVGVLILLAFGFVVSVVLVMGGG